MLPLWLGVADAAPAKKAPVYQVPAARPSLPLPLAIEAVRFGTHSGQSRIVIEFNQRVDFRVFHLSDPTRLVVDLPPGNWHAPKSGLLTERMIKGYRSGALDDGLTRIIFDLGAPALVSQAFMLPKTSFNLPRLVIDLKPASVNLFQARLGDVHGNRDLKGPGKARKPDSDFARMQDRIARDIIPAPADDAPVKSIPGQPQRKPFGKRKYTIVIDPGHGGADPGAVGKGGAREKHITLQVAKQLARQLEETGRYKAVLTRNTDVYIRLRERVAFSRRVKGDLFISIHADKIGRTGVRGASLYTLSENASDHETARLAEQENNSGVVAGVDLAAESQDVADILLDLAMREKMNESKLLGKYVEEALINNSVRLLPNSHRAAGFAVLKAPDVPSVLIETGFLSNADEVKLLTSPQFHRKISGAIVDGIDAYFRKIHSLQKL
ncbi:MAG: N-acetylmuramoyl-L-alanine amidase [Alphaproteobacteria bacterium]